MSEVSVYMFIIAVVAGAWLILFTYTSVIYKGSDLRGVEKFLMILLIYVSGLIAMIMLFWMGGMGMSDDLADFLERFGEQVSVGFWIFGNLGALSRTAVG